MSVNLKRLVISLSIDYGSLSVNLIYDYIYSHYFVTNFIGDNSRIFVLDVLLIINGYL